MTQISKKNSTLETERLYLRQPSEKDIEDIVRNISDLKITKWLAVVSYPYTKKDAHSFVSYCEEKLKEKPRTEYIYWIELKETAEVIGGIGLSDINYYSKKGTLGYWIATQHHGNGYGSEALQAVINLAFKELKLNRLEAGVFVGNPSSGKLLEKYGFKLEGTKRQAIKCKATGIVHDEYLYGLLRSEYILRGKR